MINTFKKGRMYHIPYDYYSITRKGSNLIFLEDCTTNTAWMKYMGGILASEFNSEDVYYLDSSGGRYDINKEHLVEMRINDIDEETMARIFTKNSYSPHGTELSCKLLNNIICSFLMDIHMKDVLYAEKLQDR